MRVLIGKLLALFLAALFTVVCLPSRQAAAKLPPEIMADKYLIQAEQLHADEDFAGAFEVMQKIIALQRAHSFTLADAFHFKYAQMALSAGTVGAAMESVNQYLTAAGKEGEFYREALELLIQVEQIQTLLDEYPAQVERLMVEKDHEAAFEVMDKIVALHRNIISR